MTQQYLCILDYGTGIAEIGNVCLITARDKQEARDLANENFQLVQDAKHKIKVYLISEMPNNWCYYY